MDDGARPAEHTRLRTPVTRTFTPRRVSVLTSEFEALADRLLDDCLAMGRFDAMRDYALPLVHGSMARMSGIPEERHVRFSEGVRDIETIDNTRESVERMATAVEQMGALFSELLSKRRARPRDDLISAIAAVEQDALDWEDRVATCVLIISAAAGVTVGAIGNSLRALLDNPGECKRFRDGSAAPGDAVEELLRFDPTPVGLVRSAREDLVAFDVHVKKGEQVIALVGAANRDPEAFDEPDRVDLTRRPLTHLAFGHGRHFCLGASLARAQVGVALQRLLERAPNIQRTPDSLAWRGGLQRVLSSLHVSV